MESGSVTKPVIGPGPAATPRGDLVAAFRAVRTQLPPAAAVQQVAPVEPVRFEPGEGLARQAAIDAMVSATLRRETVIDERTRAVVSQTVETATGEVVTQTPDEAILKLRAYLREMAAPKDEAGPARTSRTA
jgi:hypothetical protein